MLFVAEIGMNADGNFELNYELIRQAKWAGADIAKFQVGWRGGKDEINFMDKERLETLKRWCTQFSIGFMASIITPEAWELVKSVAMDRYKIASRTVAENPDLCRETLRRYPPLSTIPRAATRAFEWEGYTIPAGTMVVIYPIHTQHMSEWWERKSENSSSEKIIFSILFSLLASSADSK